MERPCAVHHHRNHAVQARNSGGGGEAVTRGQGVGNLSSGCGCVRECVVHACGSLLCHGEEGVEKEGCCF